MCTAASFKAKNRYFGRNLDYEFSYDETVTVMPRRFPLEFRAAGTVSEHYAMIGMAFVQKNFPLYYDATNEKGLSVAGLNFPGNAAYLPFDPAKVNVAPFEFIPWLLCDCATVDDAEKKLASVNLFAEDFSPELPASPLHYLVSDGTRDLVVEPLPGGVRLYDNPVGVLTNNPTFDWHLLNLANYMGLTREEPVSRFASGLDLTPFSRGMGAVGLPGDLSSQSRFVKAAFTRMNALKPETEAESVAQFFHILASVEQQKGCCRVKNGFEYTIYSSCVNADTGVYYYTTYNNSAVTAVNMHSTDLSASSLSSFPLLSTPTFTFQN